MDELPNFTRRNRPGWIRPSEGNRDAKRLKGLDEFTKPAFVGRMERVRRRGKRVFGAALVICVFIGIGIGLALF